MKDLAFVKFFQSPLKEQSFGIGGCIRWFFMVWIFCLLDQGSFLSSLSGHPLPVLVAIKELDPFNPGLQAGGACVQGRS